MLKTGNKKTAIILFNLGGPDSLKNVRPFLYNLFSDKWIIRLPFIIRHIIAFFISKFRYKSASENYKFMGGKSPLLEGTNRQKNALETELYNRKFDNFRIFISMRYWHPFYNEIIKDLKEYNPEEIIFLPLYPQFSSSTTLSSFEEFESGLQEEKINSKVKKIGCYYDDKDFISSHIFLIKEKIKKFKKDDKVKILFSAHSIPTKFVESGDPYEWQINKTLDAILEDDDIKKYEHILCYQSRVGLAKWLGPSTKHEIESLAKDGINIIIVPISFISEHIETLVELDIEYKLIADKYNIKYERVAALGIEINFIKSLAKIVEATSNNGIDLLTYGSELCPKKFTNCICRRG